MEAERETKAPWNSWEDLILVCLVQRHGSEESWETISTELKSRVHQNPARSHPPEFFTPQECMHRFPILHQRFLATRETSDDFEKMIQAMKDEYTKICKETLKREVETHDVIIKSQEENLERLRIGEEGDLKTIADKVIVNADEDGDGDDDDEPSLKMNGGDESGRVGERNELDRVAVRGNPCKAKMNKTMMYKVLKKLQRPRGSKILHQKLFTQKMTDLYREIIRQHMDLDLSQFKIIYQEEYTQSFHLFFRDLFLIYNNAIVFFDKGSQEHNMALKLRKVVRKEMEKVISNPAPEEDDIEEEIELRLVVIGLPAASSAFAKSARKPRSVRANASYERRMYA